jgi:lysozyme
VYIDTLGVATIGIGRNITSSGPGLSDDECLYLLRNDITRCRNQLERFKWYTELDEVRKDAIVELVFNLGLAGFLNFKNTIKFIEQKNFEEASKNLLKSKWAKQVREKRSKNIAHRLRTGQYP